MKTKNEIMMECAKACLVTTGELLSVEAVEAILDYLPNFIVLDADDKCEVNDAVFFDCYALTVCEDDFDFTFEETGGLFIRKDSAQVNIDEGRCYIGRRDDTPVLLRSKQDEN